MYRVLICLTTDVSWVVDGYLMLMMCSVFGIRIEVSSFFIDTL